MTFQERFRKALKHAKLDHLWDRPTDLGKALGFSKQTVSRWTEDGEPKPRQLFIIADKMKVDPRWLATEEGGMLIPAATSAAAPMAAAEADLLARYRVADPRWQLSLRLLSLVATEDQFEVAGDVNLVLARIFGKKPRDLKYVGDQEMRDQLKKSPEGWPPRPPKAKTTK